MIVTSRRQSATRDVRLPPRMCSIQYMYSSAHALSVRGQIPPSANSSAVRLVYLSRPTSRAWGDCLAPPIKRTVTSRKTRHPGASPASGQRTSTQDSVGQLQALAEASRALTTELPLESVLQKIAEVARDVLGARYAALGVINEAGTGLSQFLTAGVDEATTT